MNKFENGKIYKITNMVDDRIYVGSTTKELKVRFREHVCFSKIERYRNIELYKLMNEHGSDKFKIELVEKYPCENKTDLLRREGFYIFSLDNFLNHAIPGRTHDEWCDENKERIREYARNSYYRRKEAITARVRVAFKFECGGTYCIDTKTRHLKSIKHNNFVNNTSK